MPNARYRLKFVKFIAAVIKSYRLNFGNLIRIIQLLRY